MVYQRYNGKAKVTEEQRQEMRKLYERLKVAIDGLTEEQRQSIRESLEERAKQKKENSM